MEDNAIGTDTSVDTQSSSAVDTQASQDVTTQAAKEPTVLDLDENALIRIKGQDKPIKFGEYGRNFQSQFTKASQKAAQLQRELQARDAKLAQLEQERQLAAQRPGQPGGQDDIYSQLSSLPYLDGPTAVKVVQSIGQQMQQRDQILMGTLQKLKSLADVVERLNETHANTSFDSKIDKWLTENNWSPDLRDLAKEVYLAYTGDDLDIEFPRIFASRVEQMRKAFEAERQAAIRAAKPAPFIPGKGGKTGPSKPLDIKADASAKDIADQMWNLFQGSGT